MALFIKYFMTVIGITAIVGYLIQVRHVSYIYFEYKVEIHWYNFAALLFPMPKLHACFDLVDTLDRASLLQDLEMDMKRPGDPAFDRDTYLRQLKKLTIKQLFKYTLTTDQLLNPVGNSCSIRYPHVFAVKDVPSAFCGMLFNVSKYLHKNTVCYRYDPIVPGPLREVYKNDTFPPLAIQEYVTNPDRNRLIYELILNQDIFQSLTLVSSFIETPGSSVTQDSSGSFEYNFNFVPGSKKFKSISVYAWISESIRLPPPYYTKCVKDIGYRTLADLMVHKINLKTVEHFNAYTPMGHITDPNLDWPILSILDYRNTTFLKLFAEIINLKNFRPDILECHVEATGTYGHVTPTSDKLSVSVVWPRGVNFKSTFVPYQELTEYIIFMFSCSGFWFGTSFLTIYGDIAGIKKFYSTSSKDKVAPSSHGSKNSDHLQMEINKRFIRETRTLRLALRNLSSELDCKVDILYQHLNDIKNHIRQASSTKPYLTRL